VASARFLRGHPGPTLKTPRDNPSLGVFACRRALARVANGGARVPGERARLRARLGSKWRHVGPIALFARATQQPTEDPEPRCARGLLPSLTV
jgi:hypothetical protein